MIVINRFTRFAAAALCLCALLAFSLTPSVAQEATPPAPTAQPTPMPRPAPASVWTNSGVVLELFFDTLPQGRAGVLRVTGEGVESVRARFLERISEFFPIEGDGFFGLVAAGMEQMPRAYDLLVVVRLAGGASVSFTVQVQVVLGGFIRQDFAIPPDRAYLVDPQVERVEFARLEAVMQAETLERLWDENGFRLPIQAELTSPFGAFRVLNQTVETRHTGWDLRAAVGTPVLAAAAGRVAFAGLLDIRGNHIIIDHGYGVYSGYSHLSQIHVTRGQSVIAGQIIGVSGNTGRSSGPHLHWELVVNDQFVDSRDFLQMWLPGTGS